MLLRAALVVFIGFFGMFFSTVNAQVPAVILSVNSASFSPGDRITLVATSYTFDLDTVGVNWTVNGTTTAEGVGLTQFSTIVGPSGSSKRVVVSLFDPRTQEVLGFSDITIAPASVDIIWEADSYTHPFYQGRTLAGAGATVRLDGRAQFITETGKIVPASALFFEWSLNNAPLKTQSGFGKSTLRTKVTSPFGEAVFGVKVSDPKTGVTAQSKVRVPFSPPIIDLYPVDPLLGVNFSRAVQGTAYTQDLETTFMLIPRFSLVQHLLDPRVRTDWFVGDKSAPSNTDSPLRITFVAEEGGIDIKVRAAFSVFKEDLQEAARTWRIVFDSSIGSTVDLFRGDTTQ